MRPESINTTRLVNDLESSDFSRVSSRVIAEGVCASWPLRLRPLLEAAPDPAATDRFLRRFQAEHPGIFEIVLADNTAIRYLVAVFSYSTFLAEAVLQNPNWIIDRAASGDMHRVLSVEDFEDRFEHLFEHQAITHAGPQEARPEPTAPLLSTFRRREMLRLVLRDVLRLGTLSDITEEISNLADAILRLCLRSIQSEVTRNHGAPSTEEGIARFSVIAVGKLGGSELNYSSDIDLMFIYSGNGTTTGPKQISNKEYFKKIANLYTELLSTYTNEGHCYRVDLRLRPDGRLGEVCQSLEGAKDYYRERARDWELQMLIKARVAAGDPAPGTQLLEFVQPLIYSSTLDFKTVETVSETRERIHEKARRAAVSGTPSGLDVKLAPGGIRDIEFLVQCLQRLHGGREPWVRHGGTLFALFRLRDKDLLSDSEYARLASAYQFLRNVEHRLQFDQDRQIHSLPQTSEELEALARKMPNGLENDASAGSFLRELDEHLAAVREIYDRVIRAQRPAYYQLADPGTTNSAERIRTDSKPSAASSVRPDDEFRASRIEPCVRSGQSDGSRRDRSKSDTGAADHSLDHSALGPAAISQNANVQLGSLRLLIGENAPQLAAVLREFPGGVRLDGFLERLAWDPSWLEVLNHDPELCRCTLDFFSHSQYFADQLIRHPELIDEIAQACGFRQGRTGFHPPDDMAELRRFFRRQMVRIQSDSVYHRVPVFKTLKRTSDLADAVIRSAYEIAVAEVLSTAPPKDPAYAPDGQMIVIALGRLGMKEFDLASDADLVFVLPEQDASESVYWTGVAERMIQVITAYTGDGVIFTVDTRLRPNGREGALVQTVGMFESYFEKQAEVWEGIAYMKARAVAGDVEAGKVFLKDLQAVDWRRYGQSGRSRHELAGMRARIEKEQGARNPLKAGPGGYYDIDFALMYLRLKGAGMFFDVLNTPKRIAVIEQMGHLSREDANFLNDAAAFYRALDHGLRVASGHAEGRLPTASAQIQVLTELVYRWIPDHFRQSSLEVTAGRIQNRTRRLFDRIFES